MKKVLITGASGDVGTRLRKILSGAYPDIRISDIKNRDDVVFSQHFQVKRKVPLLLKVMSITLVGSALSFYIINSSGPKPTSIEDQSIGSPPKPD